MIEASEQSPLEEILRRSYSGKRVLITGHNGFVGSWLTYMLLLAGAEVVGFSLPQDPGGIADMIGLEKLCLANSGDVRDLSQLNDVLQSYAPEIVFHLAAQPLVLTSFEDPVDTLETNVMGTVHVLEALRRQSSVTACVVITSDKCYATSTRAHEESDPFGGDDVYSASKGAAEIVIHAYRHSFFQQSGLPVASARAGNIIGGGDWSKNRIVPDVIRAIRVGAPVLLRQPKAIRPWQHVLDAVAGYLRLADALVMKGAEVADGWNFGPPPDAAVTVAQLVDAVVARWRELGGVAKDPIHGTDPVTEREYLTLLSTKAERQLGWHAVLGFDASLNWTTEWYFDATASREATGMTEAQVSRFLKLDSSTLTSDIRQGMF